MRTRETPLAWREVPVLASSLARHCVCIAALANGARRMLALPVLTIQRFIDADNRFINFGGTRKANDDSINETAIHRILN